MRRREFFALPALALAPARPNVLVILSDDLGSADLGWCGGEIQTPNLDRFAGEGVRFGQFYAFPVCSPTRSGLMTGRSPMRFGCMYHVIRPWYNYGVPTEEHFMPESFRAAGYQTGMAGKWHLGHSARRYLPNARGFEQSYGHLNGAIDYFTHERDGGLDWHRNGRSVREDGYSTDLIAAEAVRFIKARDRARPFFFYTAFNAPHAPLEAPQALLGKYAKIEDPKRRAYAAMVDAMDTGVGRILKTLEEERIGDNTIVLFMSDNGGPTNLGSHNRFRDAKGSTWEGGIRVPAVLRWTAGLKGRRESQQVGTVLDVFPTLASAAGVAPRNRLPLDGKDLWGAIKSGRVEPREDLFFAVDGGAGQPRLAVRRREWKLVRDGGRSQLFRLDEDPKEANDLAAKNPQLVKELDAALDKWTALHPKVGTRFSGAAPKGWMAPKQWAEAAV